MAEIVSSSYGPAAAPTTTSAVRTASYSYVFFARGDNKLGYLKGPITSKNRTRNQDPYQYTAELIITKRGAVENHHDSHQVAALAYVDESGKTQLRVYFVDFNGNLAEICSHEDEDDLAPWSLGSLSEGGGKVIDPKSMISCSVDYQGTGKLNVFYQLRAGGPLRVAQVSTGSTAWGDYEVNNVWE